MKFKNFIFLCCFVPFLCHASDIIETKRSIGLLSVEGEIKPTTYVYVKKALEEFAKQKVSEIILHLNTPGGEVFSAVRIAEALKGAYVPIRCYIDNWAVSAGALLAYACPEIYISKTAIMGAAEPIQSSIDGVSTASEKINSALRAEFASRAELYGRSSLLAKAMVDKDILLVEREGILTLVPDSDVIQAKDRLVSPKGKLLTLTAEELLRFGIAKKIAPALGDLIPTNAEVISYKDVREGFLSFLAHPLIATLLTVGFLVGIFLEVTQPGVILPGVLGLLCLGLTLLTQYSLELFNFLEMIFLILGLLLLLFEFLIYPAHGVLAVLGVLSILTGAVLLVVPQLSCFEIPHTILFATFLEKIGAISMALLLFLGGVAFLSKRLVRFIFEKSPLVLRESELNSSEKELSPLKVGIFAEAATPLRPSGKITIAGMLYNALSEGEYIPIGAKVQVARIDGATVVIKRLGKGSKI
jgi:membrane-bound serine protease (ClpP class)